MGKKSDKKFKSDRVNALRKQYDAFLEEDKKRKERNEYILGRLDNMRYTSTAVQIRHKIGYGDVVSAYNRVTYRPDEFERRDIQIAHPNQQISRANHQNLQLDVPRTYLDDTSASLLKEISKSYILIPKLRPPLTNDYGTIPPQSLPPVLVSPPKTNTISNEDWKSKYDILEQLKKNEKEEQANKYGKDELIPVKESQTLTKDDSLKFNNGRESSLPIDGYDSQQAIDGYEFQNYNTKDLDTKYEHEVPEKDLSFDKITNETEPYNLELSKTSDSTDQEPSTDHAPSSGTTPNIPIVDRVEDHKLINQGLEHNSPIVESVINTNNIEENVPYNDYSEDTIPTSEYDTEEVPQVYNYSEPQVNEAAQQEEYPVEYEQPVVDEGKYPDPKKDYLDPNDYSPIEVINPIETTNKIHNEEFTQEQEAVEYPVEMLNPQEFTPEADVKLEDGVNVNPKYMASEETNEPVYVTNPDQVMGVELTEEPQDSSGIEAFDAEQTEMFYPEQTQEYAYDQQGDGYTQPAESYPQTEEYAYYENTAELQEPEFPAEINEHEETSSRYDPNYEQQYANPYEQQEYEQGQEEQQYAPPAEGYEQPQQQYEGYEYEQTDQDAVQSVEQVLDNEQGYVEKHNLEANGAEKTEQREGVIEQ